MFSLIRQARPDRVLTRAFSTTPSRSSDVSRLIIVGRVGKEPEVRTTKSDKEYVAYTVATTNYPSPPLDSDGNRPPSTTTWHNIYSFNPASNNYLRTLQKGSHVYVEANFELREPDPSADPSTPQGQRQVFLRHECIRLLRNPPQSNETTENPERHSDGSS